MRITIKIMQYYNIKIANRDTFIMAVVLFYLQDRKHTLLEIKHKIGKFTAIINADTLLEKLMDSKLIEREEEFYKIKIETLF